MPVYCCSFSPCLLFKHDLAVNSKGIMCGTGPAQSVGLQFNPLRKHAYSNILKISPPKTESFQIKILIFFIFLLKR